VFGDIMTRSIRLRPDSRRVIWAGFAGLAFARFHALDRGPCWPPVALLEEKRTRGLRYSSHSARPGASQSFPDRGPVAENSFNSFRALAKRNITLRPRVAVDAHYRLDDLSARASIPDLLYARVLRERNDDR